MGFDGLHFASSALRAQAAALDVTGENLARMNTPGYTRQRLVPQVGPGLPLPLTPIEGAGPSSPLFPGDGVERFRDQLLDRTIRTQESALNAEQTAEDIYTRANEIFDEITRNGITKTTSAFFDTLQRASLQPQDISLRATVVEQARSLASTFAQRANQLQSLRTEAYDRANQAIGDINSILTQLADLNASIPVQGTTESNRLQDQRDLLLDKLSGMMDIEVAVQPQGDVIVYQSAVPIVFGRTARTLSLDADALGNTVVETEMGKQLSKPGATVGALLDARNTTLASFASQLDTLATTLVSEVNTRLANSYDLNGNAGAALFTGTSALEMRVAMTDPRTLAFAAASLESATAISSGTPVDSTQSLASQLTSFTTPPTVASGTIRVNGVDVAWTDGQSLDAVLASFPAGVVATFDSSRQRVVLTRDPAFGAGPDITVTDVSGDLAASLGLTTATLNKGIPGDAGGARSIMSLTTLAVLGVPPTRSLLQGGQDLNTRVASAASTHREAAASAQALYDALTARRESQSGVDSDEEAIHMMQFQRAYEAALRLANAQDDMLDTIINQLGNR